MKIFCEKYLNRSLAGRAFLHILANELYGFEILKSVHYVLFAELSLKIHFALCVGGSIHSFQIALLL